MRVFAVVVSVIALGGCTVVGLGGGIIWGVSHNRAIDRENAMMTPRAALPEPVPTDEERARCEARRQVGSTAAAAATTAEERARILAEMPNCHDVYALTGLRKLPPPPAPIPKRHSSVELSGFIGLLVGACVDGAFVAFILIPGLAGTH